MAGFLSKLNVVSIIANLIMATVLTVSCVATQPPAPNPQVPINTAAQTAKDVGTGMGAAAKDIDNNAGAIKTATPAAVLPKVIQNFNNIQTDTNDLRTLQGQLTTVQTDLDQATTQVTQLQTNNTNLSKQVATLTAEKNSALQQMFMWLSVAAVVGIGVSAVLIYMGNPLGISIGIGSVVVLGCSIVIGQYTLWFAIGAGVLMLGAIGVFAYEVYKNKVVGPQLVTTVEANKLAMRNTARQYLFGNGPIPGHIDIIQSGITKAYVKKVRSSGQLKLVPSIPPSEIGTS